MAMTRNPADAALRHLSRDQRALLRETVGDSAVDVWLTHTRVDTGGWMGRRRILVAAHEGRVVLLAPGVKPYVEAIPFRELDQSLYNHVTGELVLAPAPGKGVRTLDMPSLDAQQLLQMIRNQESV